MDKVIKQIHSQDAGFKLSPKKSGETSLNLSNVILNFLVDKPLSRGDEISVSFNLYKEDFLRCLSYIVMHLPLYRSSSQESMKITFSTGMFASLYNPIEEFFGASEIQRYDVNLLYRLDGRIYLNGLKKGTFSLRNYLVENNTTLSFLKDEKGEYSLRMEMGDLENVVLETDVLPLSSIIAQFRPYITAIKSKPFILLAGISGTGKSRIVRQLAYATGGENPDEVKKPYNYEMIQVRPNWHDSTELLGYETRISGETEYVLTDFLRFLAKAWYFEETPFFLCLDEMNLAPVEQYFAEYLSVLETRKLNNGRIISDSLLPPLNNYGKKGNTWVGDIMMNDLFGKDWKINGKSVEKNKEREARLREQFRTEGIALPPNLIVMGTVNMDETTFSFSRKVLDRAMTIEMNKVDFSGGLTKKDCRVAPIASEIILPNAVEAMDVYEANQIICDHVISYLTEINGTLEGTPFKVAYRTRNEFILYVLANLQYEGNDVCYRMIRALDEMTLMKVLSRIEGDKNKLMNLKQTGCVLDDLATQIKQSLEKVYQDFDASDNEKSIYNDWDKESVSLCKLKEMKRNWTILIIALSGADEMEALLKLVHEDFELLVSCNSYDRIYRKAAECMRVEQDSEALLSYYIWDGDKAVLTFRGISIEKGAYVPSVFFENTDYQYWIHFKKQVTEACIDTPLRKVSDGFCFNEDAQVLYGHINYGNDIGRADLKIAYRLREGVRNIFSFGYDVLAIKLDYHSDLKHIIADIEAEYRMLSLDFFRRTHHSFSEKQQGETPDIIWWNLFREVNEEFVRAVKIVVDSPRNRIVCEEVYLRADKLKRLTPKLEMQLVEHRQESGHLYRTEVSTMSVDTFENRFLKYAVRFVMQKFVSLKERIMANYPMDSNGKFIEGLADTEEELKRLVYHPFFRTVGAFKGMNQESLVLKQGTGYSQVYRDWLLLTCSYDLEEGIRSLELKDIATLYEIWCFIEVKNLVQQLLGGEKVVVDNQSRMELNKHFTYSLAKGQKSKVVFSRRTSEGDLVELAEVIYNPREVLGKSSTETSIDHTYSFTVHRNRISCFS